MSKSDDIQELGRLEVAALHEAVIKAQSEAAEAREKVRELESENAELQFQLEKKAELLSNAAADKRELEAERDCLKLALEESGELLNEAKALAADSGGLRKRLEELADEWQRTSAQYSTVNDADQGKKERAECARKLRGALASPQPAACATCDGDGEVDVTGPDIGNGQLEQTVPCPDCRPPAGQSKGEP